MAAFQADAGIRRRLYVLNFLIALSGVVTVLGAIEISNGASYHKFNFQHV